MEISAQGVPDLAQEKGGRSSKATSSAQAKAGGDDNDDEAGSNLEDTEESEMSVSSVEDYEAADPETALQDHELPTSGSESSLGEDFLRASDKAQKQAEKVIKRHRK